MGRRKVNQQSARPVPKVELVPKPQSNPRASGWLIGGAIASSILLLGIFFYLPATREPTTDALPEVSPSLETDSHSQPSQATTSSGQIDRSGDPSPVAEPTIKLPESPIEMATEVEQPRLLAEVERAVKQFPDDVAVLQVAGLTYAELLQTQRATELLQRAMTVDRRNIPVLIALTKIYAQLGKYDEAVTMLQQAVDDGAVTAELLDALGEAYSQTGHMDKASQTLARAVELDPNSSVARLHFAQTLIQQERFEEAEKQARVAIERGQTDRAAYVALSTALVRLDKREEAMTIRGQMLKIDPQVMPDDTKYQKSFRGFASHTYASLAAAHARRHAATDAEALLMRSLELEPNNLEATALMADMLRRSGRLQDSIALHQRLVALQPENIYHYHNLASLAVSVGNVALAEQSLRKAVLADSSGNSDVQLSRFLLGVDEIDAGLRHAQIAVDRLGTIDAYLILISAFQMNGDRASAFATYRKAREIAPTDPRLANFQP